MTMTRIGLLSAAAIFWAIPAFAGDRPFDWDRYNARQDACRQHDELLRECSRLGVGAPDWCATALRQTGRDCSAFGPLGASRR